MVWSFSHRAYCSRCHRGRLEVQIMGTVANWSLMANVTHIENVRNLGVGHLTTYDLDGKTRKDWSGNQSQLWSSDQYVPQKTKFPYNIKRKLLPKTGRKGGQQSTDDSGGQWYFEHELIMTYAGDKQRFNASHDQWTGGKILMTKQQASEMNLSHGQIMNYYNQDKNTPSDFQFFEYRKDGSITGIKKKALMEALI